MYIKGAIKSMEEGKGRGYSKPYLCLFINADGILGQTGQLLSHNTFCYCQNDSVNN